MQYNIKRTTSYMGGVIYCIVWHFCYFNTLHPSLNNKLSMYFWYALTDSLCEINSKLLNCHWLLNWVTRASWPAVTMSKSTQGLAARVLHSSVWGDWESWSQVFILHIIHWVGLLLWMPFSGAGLKLSVCHFCTFNILTDGQKTTDA